MNESSQKRIKLAASSIEAFASGHCDPSDKKTDSFVDKSLSDTCFVSDIIAQSFVFVKRGLFYKV